MSAALKSGSRCRALVLARPTVTPWHTHAWPHSTQSSASPAVCGLTCVPTRRAALFLPRTHGAPPARSAPSTKVPFCTRAARVLWNPGHSLAHTQPAGLSRLREPSENSRDFRRACRCTHMHCTHARGQGRRPQQQHPRAGAVGSATRQGVKREPPTVGCTCRPSLQRPQLTGARSSRQQTLQGTPNTAWSSFPAARRGSTWPIYPAWRTG